MNIDRINPPTLAAPRGYSHVTVVSAARQVHVSGQVAFDAHGQTVGKGDLTAQAEQVFANLQAALSVAGGTFANVFKVVTDVVDLTPEKAAAIRAVRMKYLGDGPYPASTMVGVTALITADLLLEVEVIAGLD